MTIDFSLESLRKEVDYLKEKVYKLEEETDYNKEKLICLSEEIRNTIDSKIHENKVFNEDKFSEILKGVNSLLYEQAGMKEKLNSSAKEVDKLSEKFYNNESSYKKIIVTIISGIVVGVVVAGITYFISH